MLTVQIILFIWHIVLLIKMTKQIENNTRNSLFVLLFWQQDESYKTHILLITLLKNTTWIWLTPLFYTHESISEKFDGSQPVTIWNDLNGDEICPLQILLCLMWKPHQWFWCNLQGWFCMQNFRGPAMYSSRSFTMDFGACVSIGHDEVRFP